MREFDRRGFLKLLGATTLYSGVDSLLPFGQAALPLPLRFNPTHLGLTINYRNAINWFDERAWDLIGREFQFPGKRVRVAAHHDMICSVRDKYNFDYLNRLMDLATQHGKLVTLQLGAKTFGGQEVNLADWLISAYPSLLSDGVAIGVDSDIRSYILEFASKVSEKYLMDPSLENIIDRKHVENEAESERIAVSRGRFIFPELLFEERKEVDSIDHFSRENEQNIPIDTDEKIPLVWQHYKVLGLNIYNQAGNNALGEWVIWNRMKALVVAGRVLKRKIKTTEYQAAPWLNESLKPAFPFSREKFFHGLRIIKNIDPDHEIDLWDMEQVYGLGDRAEIKEIESLVA